MLSGKATTPHALVLELGQSELQTGLGRSWNVNAVGVVGRVEIAKSYIF